MKTASMLANPAAYKKAYDGGKDHAQNNYKKCNLFDPKLKPEAYEGYENGYDEHYIAKDKVFPRFINGCSNCIYLGQFEDHDLYYHRSEIETTLIARWGDNGDYHSGMCFANAIPALGEAKRRAMECKLIKS